MSEKPIGRTTAGEGPTPAAGPVKRTHDFEDRTTVRELIDHAVSLKRPRHLRIDQPDPKLTLSRAGVP